MSTTMPERSRKPAGSDQAGPIDMTEEEDTSTKLFKHDSKRLARVAKHNGTSSAVIFRHLFRKILDAAYIKALDEERDQAE